MTDSRVSIVWPGVPVYGKAFAGFPSPTQASQRCTLHSVILNCLSVFSQKEKAFQAAVQMLGALIWKLEGWTGMFLQTNPWAAPMQALIAMEDNAICYVCTDGSSIPACVKLTGGAAGDRTIRSQVENSREGGFGKL